MLLNLSPYAAVLQSLSELCDVLLVNAHEASQFLGGAEMPGADAAAGDWEQVRLRFAAQGLDRAVVTLGANGSVVLDSHAEEGRRITRICPTKVDAVDTTGAGDAFTGALAARLAAGETLAEAAAFASVAAALAATKKGTQAAYPRLETWSACGLAPDAQGPNAMAGSHAAASGAVSLGRRGGGRP